MSPASGRAVPTAAPDHHDTPPAAPEPGRALRLRPRRAAHPAATAHPAAPAHQTVTAHPAAPAHQTVTDRPAPADRPERRRLRGRTVVFLHAHPDDEAIFTAATMHRLARQGARVVLVTATAGELGPVLRPLRAGQTLADLRRTELERACAALGVARLVLLDRRDSGMPGWAANSHPDALATADLPALVRGLAGLCAEEGADALVHYDPGGIYAHPDHLAVHRIGAGAAALAGITAYQATVDRDQLGRVGTHLVQAAAAATGGPARLGRSADEITTVVAADPAELAAKRAAMAAHASQIPGPALRERGFARRYGREWYVRVGPPSVLEAGAAALPAAAR